jgi:NAD(P)-dependent dehydrogenase (short-subunit alcohol dehydrogenase family)
VVITGASDGIGAAAARLLRARGDRVILVGRSATKTEAVARELDSPFYLCDFANLDEVRTLGERLGTDLARIDVLANNAGGIMGGRLLTVDSNELTIQVNHLAPFLLTNLLLDTLIASSASVIATSSLINRRAGKIDLSDMTLAHGYSAQDAYAKAKLMNILFARELHLRYHAHGLNAAAFNPGVVRTSFSSEFGGSFSWVYSSALKHLLRSPEKGAQTLVWLASNEPDDEWRSGEYFHDKQVAKANRQAYWPSLASGLWDASLEATGLH